MCFHFFPLAEARTGLRVQREEIKLMSREEIKLTCTLQDWSRDLKICVACGFQGHRLKRCAGCRVGYYCNVGCQKIDWSHHKHRCDPDFSFPLGTRGIQLKFYPWAADETSKCSTKQASLDQSSAKFCLACGVDFPKLKKCIGCKMVYYCSAACHKRDWVNHKLQCNLSTRRNS